MSIGNINSGLAQAESVAQIALNRTPQALPQTPIDPGGLHPGAQKEDTLELSGAAKAKAAAIRTVLSAGPGAQKTSPLAQEAPETPSYYTRADLADLFDQWGAAEPGSAYDFNEDGRVDASDLAQLISKLGSAKPEAHGLREGVYTNADIERLRDAWNNGSDPSRQVEARYDFDGDGRVNASDLAQLLARLGGPQG